MANDNYLALAQGLKLYTDAMRRFVRERLTARYGARWWEDGVLTHLYDPQRSNLERDVRSNANREKHDFIDPGHLVFIIAEESRGAFAGDFDNPRRLRSLLQLVADARNSQFAHSASGDLPLDDVYFALSAMEQVLSAAGQTEAHDLRGLRSALKNGSTELQTPARVQNKAKVKEDMTGVITNATDLVADDVAMKRVLCPACEVKVFQTWPGGWDGHSGWKCAGLTASDPEERKREFRTRYAHLFRRR